MLQLKLIHVSKGGHWSFCYDIYINYGKIYVLIHVSWLSILLNATWVAVLKSYDYVKKSALVGIKVFL